MRSGEEEGPGVRRAGPSLTGESMPLLLDEVEDCWRWRGRLREGERERTTMAASSLELTVTSRGLGPSGRSVEERRGRSSEKSGEVGIKSVDLNSFGGEGAIGLGDPAASGESDSHSSLPLRTTSSLLQYSSNAFIRFGPSICSKPARTRRMLSSSMARKASTTLSERVLMDEWEIPRGYLLGERQRRIERPVHQMSTSGPCERRGQYKRFMSSVEA